MKRILFFLSFLILLTAAYAQKKPVARPAAKAKTSTKATLKKTSKAPAARTADPYNKLAQEFLLFIRKDQPKKDSLILVDKLAGLGSPLCMEQLAADDFFTEKETGYIAGKMSDPGFSLWKQSFLPYARIIEESTLKAVFADKNQSWKLFQKEYGLGYYTYTAPVFLRNNTYCVFYYDYHCGPLCGYGELVLYKKTKKGWQREKSICKWIS